MSIPLECFGSITANGQDWRCGRRKSAFILRAKLQILQFYFRPCGLTWKGTKNSLAASQSPLRWRPLTSLSAGDHSGRRYDRRHQGDQIHRHGLTRRHGLFPERDLSGIRDYALNQLHRDTRRFAAADAERGDAAFAARLLQGVDQRHDEDATTGGRPIIWPSIAQACAARLRKAGCASGNGGRLRRAIAPLPQSSQFPCRERRETAPPARAHPIAGRIRSALRSRALQ